MRKFYLIAMCILFGSLYAQVPQEIRSGEELEQLAGKTDAEIEDDTYWQRLTEYRKHPVDLNNASEEDLKLLGMLTDLQIKNFLQYRRLLGKLISVYELQAIPSWNLETIRQITAYVKINDQSSVIENFRSGWKGGDQYLLVRTSRVLEKSKGFKMSDEDSASHYLGNPQRIFFRYTYNYKSVLQYGILGDKDAGEQFFRGYQHQGFDFYSIHFFIRKNGIISALALGDFTANMGQGLIQWQTLAFSKSANVLAIKRQAAVLLPYHAAGEFNFHRGAGITLKKGRWEATGFVSFRKPSANLSKDSNSKQEVITSFDNSGYHRTKSENEGRNNIKQFVVGANINFSTPGWQIGFNAIHYSFSNSIQKQNEPYNLYAIRGNHWSDYSLDYSMTCRNVHFFGEIAIDETKSMAFIQGALISLTENLEAALLYRNISKGYQSLNADAFTENTNPGNEKGIYAGITVRPFPGCHLDGFFDIYQFPWLKYQSDAPTYGRDFFIDVFYQPEKNWSLYSRFKNESRQGNIAGTGMRTNPLGWSSRKDWRTEITVSTGNKLTVKGRAECLWLNNHTVLSQQGFLGLINLNYHPGFKTYGVSLGLQYFETDGYDSRIYVSEEDLLYSFSIPAYYGKGFRYYINTSRKLSSLFHPGRKERVHCEGSIRWGQTIYPGKPTIGSGLDLIKGDRKSEFKLQVFLSWQKS